MSAEKPEQPLEGLVAEVMQWHRDPESPEYNECEKSPCAWCGAAAAELEKARIARETRSVQRAGSECPVVVAAGSRSILADLSLALVTLKSEGGGCPATKLVINRAITTAREVLGTQNDEVSHGSAEKKL